MRTLVRVLQLASTCPQSQLLRRSSQRYFTLNEMRVV
jgi:hypothetical protein